MSKSIKVTTQGVKGGQFKNEQKGSVLMTANGIYIHMDAYT